ncbi:alpha/beta hydrolase [Streptomyces sp. N2-109]|uniref:Alpha/beta hydrolase n=1 Tax=Streptomyces gossypii TaxID=2883101 RepID=A0ABT2K3A4_9ACTN|nr:alpha/beta hydrolase [Streptomyces gossypii]MCT2594665.1 alpha/beta hydrolase [Streptomyces gossypii]
MSTTALPPSTLPSSALGRVVRGSGGPGLLLAHGGGGGIDANFGPILDGLSAGRTVVGPDYPGAGRTPRRDEPLTLDGLADELVATAVEEGLETFAVAGYSMGGPLAVRAALRHPERVTALILTASFASPNARMRLAVKMWRDYLEAEDFEGLAEFVTLIGAGAPSLEEIGQAELDASLKAVAATVPPGTLDHLALIDGVDIRDGLSSVAVPTLVISTLHDNLATPFHHRRLADGIPGARWAELASGHLPFVEQPEQWLSLMTDFLDDVGQ